MSQKKMNLSSDLTRVLKSQVPYSKRGRTIAKNAISMLEDIVTDVSDEIQEEIDRLDHQNLRNNETTTGLRKQLTRIRSEYAILPYKMQDDVNAISKSDFSITVFGRTLAGKSTLMEILTHGSGLSIGNGAQRFTRDIRTYHYKKLRITDVPGIAAFNGKKDESTAFEEAKKCDLIVFIITDDDVQQEVAECLKRMRTVWKERKNAQRISGGSYNCHE